MTFFIKVSPMESTTRSVAVIHDTGGCRVDELDTDARCSRTGEDPVSIARMDVRAVLCERQLQS
jgi:hypothetical protein